MRILIVTPECYPLVKTGGLADVCAALPAALNALEADVRVLLPGYPAVLGGLTDTAVIGTLDDLPGGHHGRLISGRLPDGVVAYAVEVPALFARSGNPYLTPEGVDWPDNPVRFAAFGKVAAGFGGPLGVLAGWQPDLLHGHDWQAGLMPAYVALGPAPRPATVMTIHNIAYQGQFAPALLGSLQLPAAAFQIHGVEYYGAIGFLKAGLYYADKLTTVSPTYARQIQSAEEGCGLHGLLMGRTDDLYGILNGIDRDLWDPARDPYLAAPYSAGDLAGKAANKAALRARFSLDAPGPDGAGGGPLFGLVSRFTWHKGIDLLVGALPALLARGGQLVVLGAGDKTLEEALRRAAAAHPHAVAVHLGYDEPLAHQIQAGADVILVPSRAEPCGLTQLYGLRYGAAPLVRRTGGLADTIIDATPASLADGCATGFVFGPATIIELEWAIRRAIEVYRTPDRWRRLQATGMTRDFGWGPSARAYLDLYRSLRPAPAAISG